MQFKELKEKFIQRCKDNDACEEEFKRVLAAKTKKQILQIIKDNIYWCYGQTNTVDIDVLDWFGEKMCADLGIYYKGKVDRIEGKKDLVFMGVFECKMLGNSTVTKMLGNSTVTKMWDNSTVTEMLGNSTVTKMWDNSTVTEMWGNSTVTKMWGNSTVTKMLGNSTVTKMLGNSTVTEMWGNSTVTKMWDNSTVTKMLGNSTVTKMWDNSTVKIASGYFGGKYKNIKNQEGNSQVIDFNTNKIYIKKSRFELIEI